MLGKNKIEFIDSDAFNDLHNLVLLDLHQNQLKTFDSVPTSTKLDTLNLAFNFLEEIENLDKCP